MIVTVLGLVGGAARVSGRCLSEGDSWSTRVRDPSATSEIRIVGMACVAEPTPSAAIALANAQGAAEFALELALSVLVSAVIVTPVFCPAPRCKETSLRASGCRQDCFGIAQPCNRRQQTPSLRAAYEIGACTPPQTPPRTKKQLPISWPRAVSAGAGPVPGKREYHAPKWA